MNSYEEFRMSDSSNLVQAIYKFKGSNNDELMFDIGDVITVTQREDGGWWEGTHSRRGKTGWFPSNYVRVLDDSSQDNSKYCIPKTEDMTDDDKAQLMLGSLIIQKGIDNRKQVIEDLLKKEMDFIRCLTAIQKTFLEPLSSTNMLNEVEFKQLVGNLDELLDIHRALYDEVELVSTLSPREQRIGKIFLEYGAEIRLAHMKYWGNHPKAVCILEKYKDTLDTYMESKGASKPGLTVLTTSLSRPFRQLEKYAGICQELEQHFENDHPDRGDTQRSIGFYKDVAAECAKARRQKELELEVLKGTIRNWEGEDLNSLGDILHIGPVIATISGEKKDRHFVLFSSTLLILSVSQRMSAFIYEGKLPLSGISVNRLEDIESVKNAFEITGPMIERILIVCNSKNDSLKWVDLLRGQIKSCRNTSLLNTNSHSNYAPSLAPFPTPPPHKNVIPSSPIPQNKRLMQLGENSKKYLWKMSCLRPSPPTRYYLTPEGKKMTIKKKVETTYEDDMQILRVIEAYCTFGNQRQTYAGSELNLVCNFSTSRAESSIALLDLEIGDDQEGLLRDDGSCIHFGQEPDRNSSDFSGCFTPSTTSGLCIPMCKAPKCFSASSDWCCDVVAKNIKKTAKKL
nr:rho guanine nucleotide exchange factor 7-like isoform X1 [Lepeophtheirus salmonis]